MRRHGSGDVLGPDRRAMAKKMEIEAVTGEFEKKEGQTVNCIQQPQDPVLSTHDHPYGVTIGHRITSPPWR